MAGPQTTVRGVSVFADAARDLRRDGFCIVPNRLDEALIDRLKSAADALGEQWSQKFGERLRALGSMVDVPHMNDPAFGELIAHPDVLVEQHHRTLTAPDGPLFESRRDAGHLTAPCLIGTRSTCRCARTAAAACGSSQGRLRMSRTCM